MRGGSATFFGRPMRFFTVVSTSLVVSATAFLGGCGESGSSPGAASAAMRGVIASAGDCASFGPDAVEACAKAIERAVANHEATAALKTVEACEKTAGAGMCERAASGMYRPRLSAFLVTLGGSPKAEPLYPAASGTVGFQTASKTTLAASDTSVAFSRLALSVAEGQAGSQKKRR